MNNKTNTTFADFKLKSSLLQRIEQIGFKIPSPIQEKSIPIILQGSDMIGQANTGTGKTAAFGLPAINMIKKGGGVQVLVITPTRELASQVSDELFSFGRGDDLQTLTIYGGQSYSRQLERLHRGVEIVVSTPGRLLDILKSGKVKVFNPNIVILDEADEMLDMGFLEDIRKIFSFLPEERQTLLFSATMPQQIKKLADQILKKPINIDVTDKSQATNKDIKELYCVMDDSERDDAVMRLVDSEDPEKVVIFCRTKREVDRLSSTLSARGYLASGLHGDMEQNQRRRVIDAFSKGDIHILIATDVAARGLDIPGLSHVINFHLPFEAESYIHRIGRTGRAGRKGVAITLVNPRELRDLTRISKTLGNEIIPHVIPSLSDMKESTHSTLVAEIKNQKIDISSKNILDSLTKDTHIADISCKLISHILQQGSTRGPESIGLGKSRIENLLENIKNNTGRSSGASRRRGGGGGGYRGRSGGNSYNRGSGSGRGGRRR